MGFEIEIVSAVASGAISVISALLESIFRTPFSDTLIRLLEKSGSKLIVGDAGKVREEQLEEEEKAENDQSIVVQNSEGARERRLLRMRTTDSAYTKPQRRKKEVFVSSHFKLVFLTVALGTVLCAIAAAIMSITIPTMNPNEQKLFDALLSGFTLGVGAILGLLGGKSLA